MSKTYIQSSFDKIQAYANVVETRLDDSGLTMEELLRDNREALEQCRRNGADYLFIDGTYPESLPSFWL